MHPNARLRRAPYFDAVHGAWCVPLTQGVVALVDAEDIHRLSQCNWCAGKCAQGWVAQRNSSRAEGGIRHTIVMHVVIMSPPAGMHVDHKEHLPLAAKIVDNRRNNLRVCTLRENMFNQRPKQRQGRTSRFKGVHWQQYKRTGRWIAALQVNGRPSILGRFTTEEAAARLYDQEAKRHFGEFALTNAMLGLLVE